MLIPVWIFAQCTQLGWCVTKTTYLPTHCSRVSNVSTFGGPEINNFKFGCERTMLLVNSRLVDDVDYHRNAYYNQINIERTLTPICDGICPERWLLLRSSRSNPTNNAISVGTVPSKWLLCRNKFVNVEASFTSCITAGRNKPVSRAHSSIHSGSNSQWTSSMAKTRCTDCYFTTHL